MVARDHALSLYLCNLFSEGGHDAILSQITCKKARIWTSLWLDRKQYRWFALFRLAKMPPSVSCCWFQSAFCLRNEQYIDRRVRCEISAGSVFLNLKNVSMEISSIEIFSISSHTKKLQSKIHRSFECNLTPGTSYRSDKRIHFSNDQFIKWNLDLVWLYSSFTNLRIILSDLRFRNTF